MRRKGEQGCVKIEIDGFVKNILKAVKNMESLHKTILGVSVVIGVVSHFSYSNYLTHNENIRKIEASSENSRIIASLKADKELQNAINLPKQKIASSLKESETATLDAGNATISKDDKANYEFKELIDTTTTDDIIDDFFILGYEKTDGGDKKFKLKIPNIGIKWVSANIINANARIKLATAIESGNSVNLELRVIKEYEKVKEITILKVNL